MYASAPHGVRQDYPSASSVVPKLSAVELEQLRCDLANDPRTARDASSGFGQLIGCSPGVRFFLSTSALIRLASIDPERTAQVSQKEAKPLARCEKLRRLSNANRRALGSSTLEASLLFGLNDRASLAKGNKAPSAL